MSKKYTEDFKKEVVKEFLKADKQTSEIAKEYKLAESTVRDWVNKYSEECSCADEKFNLEQAKKMKALNIRIAELEKENRFLIEVSAFFTSKKK